MEKMLVTSIFSFSHNVFKRLLNQGRYKSVLCGKELTPVQTNTDISAADNGSSVDFIEQNRTEVKCYTMILVQK